MSARAEDPIALRRGVLAVSVLDDIALEPRPDGVLLATSWDLAAPAARTLVPWFRLEDALVGAAPSSIAGRLRLRDWLRLRQLLLAPGGLVRTRVVPLALPVGHALHPGPRWVQQPVPGGVLDLGLGVRQDDSVLALAPGAVACAELDDTGWWPAARARLDDLAQLAVDRHVRDGKGLLTPIGGCDVLSLLGSRALRRHLADGDGTGMRAVAAPMRTRAWFDLAHIDPAFVLAAAAATDEEHRGVGRPLLVTADAVSLGIGSSAARLAQAGLREPGAPDPVLPDVLYRH